MNEEIVFESLQMKIIYILDDWYLDVRDKLKKGRSGPHSLGARKEAFKREIDEILGFAVRQISLRSVALEQYGDDLLKEIGIQNADLHR